MQVDLDLIATALKNARKEHGSGRGISLTDLEAITGIPRSTLATYESLKNPCAPGIANLFRLSMVLGIDLNKLCRDAVREASVASPRRRASAAGYRMGQDSPAPPRSASGRPPEHCLGASHT